VRPRRAGAAAPKKDLIFVEGTDHHRHGSHDGGGHAEQRPNLLVYEGLVTYDKEMKFVPVLATKWAISQDKKSWTFSLRPNVKFANGAPFTAKAITVARIRSGSDGPGEPPPPPLAVSSAGRSGSKAPERPHVRFLTKYPFPDLTVQPRPSPTVGLRENPSE